MDEGNGGLKMGDESSGAVEMGRWAGGRARVGLLCPQRQPQLVCAERPATDLYRPRKDFLIAHDIADARDLPRGMSAWKVKVAVALGCEIGLERLLGCVWVCGCAR